MGAREATLPAGKDGQGRQAGRGSWGKGRRGGVLCAVRLCGRAQRAGGKKFGSLGGKSVKATSLKLT